MLDDIKIQTSFIGTHTHTHTRPFNSVSTGASGGIHSLYLIDNTSFSSQSKNGPNVLKGYITLGWKGLPFKSYTENEML
jgi:hypothetical protein